MALQIGNEFGFHIGNLQDRTSVTESQFVVHAEQNSPKNNDKVSSTTLPPVIQARQNLSIPSLNLYRLKSVCERQAELQKKKLQQEQQAAENAKIPAHLRWDARIQDHPLFHKSRLSAPGVPWHSHVHGVRTVHGNSEASNHNHKNYHKTTITDSHHTGTMIALSHREHTTTKNITDELQQQHHHDGTARHKRRRPDFEGIFRATRRHLHDAHNTNMEAAETVKQLKVMCNERVLNSSTLDEMYRGAIHGSGSHSARSSSKTKAKGRRNRIALNPLTPMPSRCYRTGIMFVCFIHCTFVIDT